MNDYITRLKMDDIHEGSNSTAVRCPQVDQERHLRQQRVELLLQLGRVVPVTANYIRICTATALQTTISFHFSFPVIWLSTDFDTVSVCVRSVGKRSRHSLTARNISRSIMASRTGPSGLARTECARSHRISTATSPNTAPATKIAGH